MALQVGVEKEYGRLNWHFTLETLQMAGFPSTLYFIRGDSYGMYHYVQLLHFKQSVKEKQQANLKHLEDYNKSILFNSGDEALPK